MILSPHEWIFLTKARLQTSNSINNRIDYHHNFENNRRRRSKVTTVVCGIRSNKEKGPPTSMAISKESVQVIQALKLAKNSDEKLNQVLKLRLLRLLKADMLDVLAQLQRQNYLHLSLKVSEFIINEWEAGDDELLLKLYSDTILLLAKNKMIKMAEEMFNQVVEKGLKPDTRLFNEMIGAYSRVCNTEKAMNVYRSMKDSGCLPDELTFTILIRTLTYTGEHELVKTLKKESFDYVLAPDTIIRKAQQKHPKSKHIKVVM